VCFLLVHSEAIVFGADLCFTADVFFCRGISGLHRPVGMKFCMVISNRLNFLTPVFAGHPQINFRGQKRVTFGVISDNFKLWR